MSRPLQVPGRLVSASSPSKGGVEGGGGGGRLRRKRYVRVGRVPGVLEACPAEVHFEGLALGHEHRLQVRLVNLARDPARMHILAPATPFFRLEYEKTGAVVQGNAQLVTVVFTPEEYRYYHDCFRVHTEGGGEEENLTVPLHAYPVIDMSSFPRTLDFGACAVGQTYTRTLHIDSPVPVHFEYDIAVLQHSMDMDVFPVRGAIPPCERVEITVQYAPSRPSTAIMKLEVKVSQFNFEPIVCTVSGSAVVGANKQRELALRSKRLLGNPVAPGGSERPDRGAASTSSSAMSSARTVVMREDYQGAGESIIPENYGGEDAVSPLRTGGGAGGGDAVSEYYYQKRRAKRREQAARKGERKAPKKLGEAEEGLRAFQGALRAPAPQEEDVGGLRVPATLDQSGVNSVLTQTVGKLRLKDLKTLNEQRKAGGSTQDALPEPSPRGLSRKNSGTSPAGGSSSARRSSSASFSGVLGLAGLAGLGAAPEPGKTMSREQRQLEELDFRREVQAKEDFERSKRQKWFSCIGEDMLPEEKIRAIMRARMDAEDRSEAKRREHERERVVTEEGGEDDRVIIYEDNRRKRTYPKPAFTVRGGDALSAQAELFERFAGRVRRRLVQQRIMRRLRVIGRGMMAKEPAKFSLGDETEAFIRESDAEDELQKRVPRTSGHLVCTGLLPLYLPSRFQTNAVLSDPPFPEFRDFDFLTIKVPLEYKILQYTPEPMPTCPTSVPNESAREMLVGAEEERTSCIPSGHTQADSAFSLMTPRESRAPPPLDPRRALNPYPSLSPQAALLTHTEADPDWTILSSVLLPRRSLRPSAEQEHAAVAQMSFRKVDATQVLCGTTSLFAMSKADTISDKVSGAPPEPGRDSMILSSAPLFCASQIHDLRNRRSAMQETRRTFFRSKTLGGPSPSASSSTSTSTSTSTSRLGRSRQQATASAVGSGASPGMDVVCALDGAQSGGCPRGTPFVPRSSLLLPREDPTLCCIPQVLSAPRADDLLSDSDEEAQDEARERGLDVNKSLPEPSLERMYDLFHIPQPSASAGKGTLLEQQAGAMEESWMHHRRQRMESLLQSMDQLSHQLLHPDHHFSLAKHRSSAREAKP